MMAKLKVWLKMGLKHIRPGRIWLIYVAGTLMFTIQACHPAGIAKSPPHNPTKTYELNTPESGMNNFTKAAETTTQARGNVEEKSGYDTPLGEKVQSWGETIKNYAEEVREGIVKSTQEGMENLQKSAERTTEDMSKSVKRAAEDTTSNLKRQVEDTADSINSIKRKLSD